MSGYSDVIRANVLDLSKVEAGRMIAICEGDPNDPNSELRMCVTGPFRKYEGGRVYYGGDGGAVYPGVNSGPEAYSHPFGANNFIADGQVLRDWIAQLPC